MEALLFVPVRPGGLDIAPQRYAARFGFDVPRRAAMVMKAGSGVLVVEAVVMMVVMLEELGEQSIDIVMCVWPVAVVMMMLVDCRAGECDGRCEHRRGRRTPRPCSLPASPSRRRPATRT